MTDRALDLDVGDRPLPRLDAIEPVLIVVLRLGQVYVVLAQGLLEDLLGNADQERPIDLDQALGADERHAAGAAVDQLDAVGVAIADADVGLRVLAAG